MIMCISGMPHIYNCFLTLFWLCVFLQIVQECHFGVLLLHLFQHIYDCKPRVATVGK